MFLFILFTFFSQSTAYSCCHITGSEQYTAVQNIKKTLHGDFDELKELISTLENTDVKKYESLEQYYDAIHYREHIFKSIDLAKKQIEILCKRINKRKSHECCAFKTFDDNIKTIQDDISKIKEMHSNHQFEQILIDIQENEYARANNASVVDITPILLKKIDNIDKELETFPLWWWKPDTEYKTSKEDIRNIDTDNVDYNDDCSSQDTDNINDYGQKAIECSLSGWVVTNTAELPCDKELPISIFASIKQLQLWIAAKKIKSSTATDAADYIMEQLKYAVELVGTKRVEADLEKAVKDGWISKERRDAFHIPSNTKPLR